MRPRAASARALVVALGVALAGALVVTASGCSLQRLTVNQTADVLWDGRAAMESEPDPQFAREALPGSLKTLETFLESAPENERLLRLLARGYFAYAFAFLEGDLMRAELSGATSGELEDIESRTVTHYMKSHRYGLRLLGDDEFADAMRGLDTERVEKLLAEMDDDDVPGLFWSAYGLGSAANLSQDDSDMIAALPIVEATMRRVLELDETFYYSGTHLFFGVYYGSRPPMFGGDPKRAREHFERAMEQHGDKNLLIPALYARFYATAAGVQDRELFEQLLNGVLEADPERYPELRLNNEIARRRAQFWLDRADELFY
ncbi:MAG: TRAP transporter TatT component family protein [Persicimonas sp.]